MKLENKEQVIVADKKPRIITKLRLVHRTYDESRNYKQTVFQTKNLIEKKQEI